MKAGAQEDAGRGGGQADVLKIHLRVRSKEESGSRREVYVFSPARVHSPEHEQGLADKDFGRTAFECRRIFKLDLW